jgi:hypothetical protein
MVTGCCEHGNGRPCFIKGREYFEQAIDCHLLKKDRVA